MGDGRLWTTDQWGIYVPAEPPQAAGVAVWVSPPPKRPWRSATALFGRPVPSRGTLEP